MNPLLLTDAYKLGHVFQYEPGTTTVYSNMTARKSRIDGVDHIVFFGLQAALTKIHDWFKTDFFDRPLDEVMVEYKRVVENYVGPLPSYQHIEDLHKTQHLPILVKALPEGVKVPIGVPFLTITNTQDHAFWLPNFLETILSTEIWQTITSATIADQYRQILDMWATITSTATDFVQWQGHDFSFRGMSSLESAQMSGAGHLLSFTGTDTIPALLFMEKYYGADLTKELVGGSVAATEHSVMCMGSLNGEYDTFKRLITETYPNGIVSIVSDTWDLWKVLTEYLPNLKNEVMSRDGKVVIRPDSGDPVLIICGNPDGKTEAERKGVIELLWDIFGGVVNVKGYKELDPHIGAIYGDSITTDRAEKISQLLADKNFASTNLVYGIGSYTYQHVTRDTFGFAIKATFGVVNDEERAIFKDPITDDGTKKSLKGRLFVDRTFDFYDKNFRYLVHDNVSLALEQSGKLNICYCNGIFANTINLSEVRANLGWFK